jgi:hypothetical protein
MIIIIRDPVEAALAEFNRFHTNETNYVQIEDFNREKWRSTAIESIKAWEDFHNTILNKRTLEFHLVKYENLKADFVDELEKCLEFLGRTMSAEMADCISKDNKGHFKRPIRPREEMNAIINCLTSDELTDIEQRKSRILERFEERDRLQRVTQK